MAYRLKFSGRVVREIGEAFAWYEEQSQGLGSEFKLAFELQLKRLEQVPLLYAEVIWLFHRTLNALRRDVYPRRTAVKIPASTAYKSEKGNLVMTPRTTLTLFLRRMRP